MDYWTIFWTIVKVLGVFGAGFSAWRIYLLARRVQGQLRQLYQTHMIEMPERVAELEARVAQLEAERDDHEKAITALNRRAELTAKRVDALDVRTDPAALVRLMGGRYQGLSKE